MYGYRLALCLLLFSSIVWIHIDAQNVTSTIPLSKMREMKLLGAMRSKTSDEFVKMFFDSMEGGSHSRMRPKPIDVSTNKKMVMYGSADLSNVERSEVANHMVPHAGCDLYDTIVPIPNNRPDVTLYPSCVVVKQCGGCCGHPALACKPVETTEKVIQVMKFIFDGNSLQPEQKIDYIGVEEHTSCDCLCKVTADQCTPLQEYDARECVCRCKNQDQMGVCPPNKRWNPDKCTCTCAKIVNCGTGYTYNMLTCRCEELVERSGDRPNTPAEVQPDRTVTEKIDTNPCSHLTCSSGYVPKMTALGTCRCRYDRSNRG